MLAAAAITGVGCASNKKAPDLAGPGVNAYYGAQANGQPAKGTVAGNNAASGVVPASAETSAAGERYPVQQAAYQGPPHKRVITTCGPGCSCH